MKLFLVFQVYLLCCVSYSWAQYPEYFQQPINGNFFGAEFMNVPYMLPARYPYRSQREPIGREFNMRFYSHYDEYPESEECVCSCSKCARPRSCCVQFCMSCNQPSVVLMPYPYPFFMSTTPSSVEPAASTTTTPTTIKTTTTTTQSTTVSTTKRDQTTPKEARKNVNDIDLEDLLKERQTRNRDHKYILTTLRRTKDDGKPKYGIVPISDFVAESLMSHMRNVKEINK